MRVLKRQILLQVTHSVCLSSVLVQLVSFSLRSAPDNVLISHSLSIQKLTRFEQYTTQHSSSTVMTGQSWKSVVLEIGTKQMWVRCRPESCSTDSNWGSNTQHSLQSLCVRQGVMQTQYTQGVMQREHACCKSLMQKAVYLAAS